MKNKQRIVISPKKIHKEPKHTTKCLTSLFIVCMYVCECMRVCSVVSYFAIPWTITHQTPLSTGLFNRRVQIKASMIPLHTHYEWYNSKYQKQKAKNVIKDVEKLISSSIADGNGTVALGTWHSKRKINIELPSVPTTPLLSMYPEK